MNNLIKTRTIILIAVLAAMLAACSAPKQSTPTPSVAAQSNTPTPEAASATPVATEVPTVTIAPTATLPPVATTSPTPAPLRVVAGTGSLADLWLLAGGELVGASSDTFETHPEIEASVTNIGGAHSPDIEAIFALNPDLVIMSAELSGHNKLAEQFESAQVNALYLSVESFDDYLSALRALTQLTGRDDLYEQNGEAIGDLVASAIALSEGRPHPSVLLLRAQSSKVEARNSDSMAGIMLSDMGAVNIADSDSGLLEDLSIEQIILDDPEFIFATTMGDDAKALAVLGETLTSNPAWAELSAVKNGRYIVLPNALFHQKPNVRWAESYELLAEILYGP